MRDLFAAAIEMRSDECLAISTCRATASAGGVKLPKLDFAVTLQSLFSAQSCPSS